MCKWLKYDNINGGATLYGAFGYGKAKELYGYLCINYL